MFASDVFFLRPVYFPFFFASSAAFSSARAALRILSSQFPSWQAYSRTGPSLSLVSGIENVQGRVQVSGSSTVTAHFTTFGAVRVKRSVRWSVADWRCGRFLPLGNSSSRQPACRLPNGRARRRLRADRRAGMRPRVGRNDASLVDHLVNDCDVTRGCTIWFRCRRWPASSSPVCRA